MRRASAGLLIVLSLWVYGCGAGPSASQSTEEALRAVEAATAAYNDGWRSGDAAAIAAHVADSAVFVVAGRPDLRGRAAAEASWRALLATARVTKLEVRSEITTVSGDLAMQAGEWDEVVEVQDQPAPLNLHGKYLMVWQRQADGAWKILRFFATEEPSTSPPK